MSTIDEQTNAYHQSHQRIDTFTRTLSSEQLATVVPCCPLWTFRDVVGHLTGLLEDRRDANMSRGAFDEWTAAQVARQRDLSIEKSSTSGTNSQPWRSMDPLRLAPYPLTSRPTNTTFTKP